MGLITLGSGKVAGAVGLAVISAPFCAVGIGVGGEIAAGIVSASGGGDIAQGIYEIAYGWNGDSESTSFNLVRDTLYSGNEKAYHVSTGIAAICGQVGPGIAAKEAAKKAAEKELAEQMAKEAAKESKEVVEEVVKKNADDVIEEAVGQNADDVIEEAAEAAGKNLDDIAKDSGKVLNEGGSDTASKALRNTPDQNALLELAREAKKNGGVDPEDAKTIMEWAKEYDVPFHGPERHPNRPQISSQNWHFHIGNSSKTGHIPIIGDVIGVFKETI